MFLESMTMPTSNWQQRWRQLARLWRWYD